MHFRIAAAAAAWRRLHFFLVALHSFRSRKTCWPGGAMAVLTRHVMPVSSPRYSFRFGLRVNGGVGRFFPNRRLWFSLFHSRRTRRSLHQQPHATRFAFSNDCAAVAMPALGYQVRWRVPRYGHALTVLSPRFRCAVSKRVASCLRRRSVCGLVSGVLEQQTVRFAGRGDT